MAIAVCQHGIPTTNADGNNVDLLAFIKDKVRNFEGLRHGGTRRRDKVVDTLGVDAIAPSGSRRCGGTGFRGQT